MINKNLFIFACLIFLLVKAGYTQEVVNGGFELLNQSKMPRNWMFDDAKGKFSITSITESKAGRYALKIDGSKLTESSVDVAQVGNKFGGISSTKISTIEITAWVNTNQVADSTVALFIMDLSGKRTIYSFLKAGAQSGWQKQSFSYKIPANQPWYGFYYGLEVRGKRTVWCDNVTLKVNGAEIKDPASLYTEPDRAAVNWLDKHLTKLAPEVKNINNEMLAPIADAAKNAKIIGLGEPTHGTAEADEFKIRLLKYLVEEHGYTTIALEETIPTCDIMNSLLDKNNPALKDSLLSLPFYKTWKTKEMLGLLTWINEYNLLHNKKVKFIGIDMEDIRMKTSRAQLKTYGLLHDAEIFKQVKVLDNNLDSLLKLSQVSMENANTMKAAELVKNNLTVLKVHIANTVAPDHVFALLSYVRVAEQWLASRFYNGQRDEYMAENMAVYLKQHPNDRVVLWAHNFHIVNANTGGAKVMGAYLKEKFGRAYFPVSITTAGGEYMAAKDYSQKKWTNFTLEPAYKGTYEYVLAKAKPAAYFFNLRNITKGEKGATWLSTPMKHLDSGYIYEGNENYKYYGTLASGFDGVVFFKETHATTSLL